MADDQSNDDRHIYTGDVLEAKLRQRQREKVDRINRRIHRELAASTPPTSPTTRGGRRPSDAASTPPTSPTTPKERRQSDATSTSSTSPTTLGGRRQSDATSTSQTSLTTPEGRGQGDELSTLPRSPPGAYPIRTAPDGDTASDQPLVPPDRQKGAQEWRRLVQERRQELRQAAQEQCGRQDRTSSAGQARRSVDDPKGPHQLRRVQRRELAGALRAPRRDWIKTLLLWYWCTMMITRSLGSFYSYLPKFSTTADVNRTGSDPTAVSLLAGLDPMWSKLDSAKFSHCAISYLQCELYPDPSKQPFYGTYMWQHEIGWCTSPSNCAGDPRPFATQRFNTTAVGDALWWTSGVFWNISSASHSVASHMKRFYRTIGAFDTAIARVLEGTDGLWDSWLGDLVLDYEDDLCYVDADCEGENALRGLGADFCFTKRSPTRPPPTTSSVYLSVKWLLTSNYSPFTWLPLSLLVPSRDSIKSAFLLPGHICISRARQRRVLAAIAEDLDGTMEYLAEDLARDCRRRLTGLQKVLHREGFWDYDPERPHIWVGEYLWDLPPPDMNVQGARRRDSQRYQGGRLEWDGTVQGWVEGYLSHACDSLQPDDPYSYRLEDDNFQDAGIDTPLKTFMKFTNDLRSAAGLLDESALSTRGDYTSDRLAMFKPKRTLACTAPPVGLLREEIRGIGWVGEGPEMAEVRAFVSSRG